MNRDAVVWKEKAIPPFKYTTCVCLHGRLLAIGGIDSDHQPTSAVHMYNPTTDSWKVISHMMTPRCLYSAAVLPNNQLMVLGSCTEGGVYLEDADLVEVATTELCVK